MLIYLLFKINKVAMWFNDPREWNMQVVMNIKGKEGACGNVPENGFLAGWRVLSCKVFDM